MTDRTDLNSVVIRQKVDGSWQALHVPSQQTTHGLSKNEAEEAMRDLLGVNEEGAFDEPLTSDRFEGVAREIGEYLEGPISETLKAHSGFARLEGFQDGIAQIRLGGGCRGCPASMMTLANGVKAELQDQFGEEVLIDVAPVHDA